MKRFLQISLLLVAMIMTTVNANAWSFKLVSPAQGKVEKLSEIKIDRNEDGWFLYETGDVNGAKLTTPNGTIEVKINTNVTPYLISFTEQTTPGTYTLEIPKNTMHKSEGDWCAPVCGEGNTAVLFSWTIEGTQGGGGQTQDSWTFAGVTPTSGSEVTSLKNFKFNFPENGLFGSFPALTLKRGEGGVGNEFTVTVTSDNIYADMTTGTLAEEITAPGIYTMVIPANTYRDWNNKPNALMTYTWTIPNTPWTFTDVTPSAGEVEQIDGLTFNLGSGKALAQNYNLTIKDENENEYSVTLYNEDDENANGVVKGNLLMIKNPGTYTLTIEEGSLALKSGDTNSAMSYTWTIKPTGPSYSLGTDVQYVAYNTAGFWATYSNDDKDVLIETPTEVYSVTVNNDNISLNKIESEYVANIQVNGTFVPKGTGVLLLYPCENAKDITGVTSANVWNVANKDDIAPITNNMLYPSSKPMEEVNAAAYYKLAYDYYNDKTGLGFYWGATSGGAFTSKEGAAYLAVPSTVNNARSFYLFNDSETTGINNVNENVNENLNVYNLAGQRVAASQKGIMIINGKKVIK